MSEVLSKSLKESNRGECSFESTISNASSACIRNVLVAKKDQYYIGEWHFHPYSSPFPSATDLQTMHSLSEEEYLHCPEPILIIVGGKPSAWAYHVSVFASGRQVILFQT